jgi:UDP-N-acetylglucosamine--N-acetylmuramyl-(pentapeptide) pyrophosphoryl-undecaprenol N-acetylglucosamine transferase
VLATLLQKTERPALIARGLEAKKMQKLNATEAVVAACEELAR